MASTPLMARTARRRASSMATANAEAAAMTITADGVGTRRSASRKPPKPRTVPEIPSTATVVRKAGTFDSHGDT